MSLPSSGRAAAGQRAIRPQAGASADLSSRRARRAPTRREDSSRKAGQNSAGEPLNWRTLSKSFKTSAGTPPFSSLISINHAPEWGPLPFFCRGYFRRIRKPATPGLTTPSWLSNSAFTSIRPLA